MDYTQKIRDFLESNTNDELKQLDVDHRVLLESSWNVNFCFANDTHLFVYIEKLASLIAICLNKLCKSNEPKNVFQLLTINGAPIGKMRKCLINKSGTHVLLVYDKSLSAVELPQRWGKFQEYGNGKSKLICRSIQFSVKHEIIDATWHLNDSDLIVCLTSDCTLRYFSIDSHQSSNNQLKKLNLNNLTNESIYVDDDRSRSAAHQSSDGIVKFEMGKSFLFNSKQATPIFVLRKSGQIDCVIEYENSKNFENLSNLNILPYNLENESQQRIVTYLVTRTAKIKCLILLMDDGTIFHCVFMPNVKTSSSEFESENLEATNESLLFTYETIKLNDVNDVDSIHFLNDLSNPYRYFVCHANGIHSVNLIWLSDLEETYSNDENFDFNDFDENATSEVIHLISTNSSSTASTKSHIVGLTFLADFSAKANMIISLTNHFKFVFPNIQIFEKNPINEDQFSLNISKETFTPKSDKFSDYIKSLLKREINLPVLMSENDAKMDNNLMMYNIINLIKYEYIEKQRRVMQEFQSRYDLLKNQEKIQNETLREINGRMSALEEKRKALLTKRESLSSKQQKFEQRIEKNFSKLSETCTIPLTEAESVMKREIEMMRRNSNDFADQIKNVKRITNHHFESSSQLKLDKTDLDEIEAARIKRLIENEAGKIKDLVQKVDKLKVTCEKLKIK